MDGLSVLNTGLVKGVADIDYISTDPPKTWKQSPTVIIPDPVFLDDSCPHQCPIGKYSKEGDGYW